MNLYGFLSYFCLTLLYVLTLAQAITGDDARYNNPKHTRCEKGSCYPATGNLLVGRENRLFASSTCGLKTEERYCIVSHLQERKKCFRCDSRNGTENNPMLNHRIQNIIYSNFPGTNKQSWWQSENGKERVTIQLNLEAEFHFTHLIMKFRTFRPAEMLVERSSDQGKTWKVYRAFAAECNHSFPHYSKHPSSSLTEVVCDTRYSNAIPSHDGEVILRIISPSRTYSDPYSPDLQDLLKMTNLRINLTKLHTLGDDLLDKREEIQEKYYYAVREMTVRGSCWCYGHASSCLPVDGVEHRHDMVHGRCNCTHNTKGLNCEECDDFYNDLPWNPAIGHQANACKRCNCNNHATACKFSKDLYQQSGHVSGGICSDCQDNTMGNNCERCKPYYYLDPSRDISNRDACLSCNCDLGGTIDGGICDHVTDLVNGLEAGRCHCKTNIDGRYCNQCKSGYWNFDTNNPEGCEACTCDQWGTRANSSCDVLTGECNCKPNVVNKDCNQCLPQYWGLAHDSDGCKPCDCNMGGSYDNNCDVISGKCKCRPNLVGRTCDTPDVSYYVPELDMIYEGETAKCSGDCQVVIREPPREGPTPWTGPGFMRVHDNTDLEFVVHDIRTTMDYDVLVRYEPQSVEDWSDLELKIERDSPVDNNGDCANAQPEDDHKIVNLHSNVQHAVASSSACLESGKRYKIKIFFRSTDNNLIGSPSASILVDSIALIPRIDFISHFHGSPENIIRRGEYEKYMCNETYLTPLRGNVPVSDICKKYNYEIATILHGGAFDCECDRTGSVSAICDSDGGHCKCKPNVVGRTCNRCAPGTYGFGPQGCKACDCNSVGALTNFCDDQGQCPCKNGTYGRSCDECKRGSWNYPDCQLCKCNGHAQVCHTGTGECIDCLDDTTGFHCDRCKDGYYGDPRLGRSIPCRPCNCPDTAETGHSFAKRCSLNDDTQDLICECDIGYAGPRCDVCADNYYGNPEEPGGSCQPCECNNNIDIAQPGNCDIHSGECLLCLFNTTGNHCEICRPNFYGDATTQSCIECNCNLLGTDFKAGPCDYTTGQCPCLPNVQGLTCSECRPNHWKIASGQGCKACDCDPVGSLSEQCNKYTGQCECRDGFGGEQCNQCQSEFWGDPNVECQPCYCNRDGSKTLQCNKDDGTCICLEGIGGEKCDQCARGFLGEAPYCTKCGECFDNWDRIISQLADKTDGVIMNAREINRTGATGAYNSEFEDLSKIIQEVKNTLNNTKDNTAQLSNLSGQVDYFKDGLNHSINLQSQLKDKVNSVLNHISLANLTLKQINENAKNLIQTAQDLNDNATGLQEKDLKGALNLTREAGESSKQVHSIEKKTSALLNEAFRQCRRTEQFLNKDNENFAKTDQKNEDLRQHLEFELSKLEKKIPIINKNVCDGEGDPCDTLCGGGGCGTCGGISCENGAVGQAETGLKFASDTERIVESQHKETDKKFRDISHSLQDATEANKIVSTARNASLEIKSLFESLVHQGSNMTKDLGTFLNTSGTTPSEIRMMSEETLKLNIRLKPEQIKELASQINNKIASLKDVNMILEATKEDQEIAIQLKQKADSASGRAANTLGKATEVLEALNVAKTAQQEAENAITEANNDISAAKKDLTQIGSETGEAESKAKETNQKVKDLQKRLNQVKETVYKNNHETEQVSNEADKVDKEVKLASKDVASLKLIYEEVANGLKEKSDNSSKSKRRAKSLLDSANQLLTDTRGKLEELEDAEEGYKSQRNSLSKLQEEIMNLTITIDRNTKEIKRKAEYYRRCVQ